MAPKTQVNSATGLMGPSGTGKSSLLATLAKYVYRRWGKITLYYNCDGGGYPAEIQACVAAGIMRVFRMYTRDPGDLGLSFETCQRSAQGWWPQRINPTTGEVPPGVPMLPPVRVSFQMHCAAGHLVKVVPSEALLQPTFCQICKSPVTRQDMRVVKTLAPTPGFEDVGAVMYDGLTSMLAWEMRELGHRAGRLELKGEEAAIGGKVVSGDLKFGGSTRSHVGFVQARGEELVHLTLGIPNLVVPPIFTMLTHEDVDERSLSICGPKIMGRAKTDEAPQWFGNMLEAAKIPAEQGLGEQRVLYLSEFTDARGVRHLLKHRGSPGTMPDRLVDPAEGATNPAYAFTQFNLGVFFELLDAALDRRIADVRAEFPTAPGLPEGMVEIGGAQTEPLHAVQQPAVVSGPQALRPGTGAVPAAPPAPSAPVARPRAPRKPNGAAGVPIAAAAPAPVVVPAASAPVVEAPVEARPELPMVPDPAVTAPTSMTVPAAPVAAVAAPVAPPVAAPAAPRSGVAPPPGRRPTSAASGRPVASPVVGSGTLGSPAAAAGSPSPGTPAGLSVRGPTAPRAPAPAPRPPSTP